MKVKIIQVTDRREINAEITFPSSNIDLPSVVNGWRFNFKTHSKKAGFITYILVCEETPLTIEGCLIFKMKGGVEPYMAFIEIAPHNKGNTKKYDKVAGCLIAFASRLSFNAEGDYKGWLAFDVMEGNKSDEIKLMTIYSQKYGALRYGDTTMIITPEKGQQLISEYLN